MGGGEGVRKKFPLQSLLYKSLTTKQPNKKRQAKSTVNKLRKEKLREVTKCLLTQFSEIQVDVILNLISLDSYFKNFCYFLYIFSKLNKNYYYYYYYYYYCYYYYYHNYNKILKSDCLSTALISALIGQCASRLSNWKVHAATRALKWLFFHCWQKRRS